MVPQANTILSSPHSLTAALALAALLVLPLGRLLLASSRRGVLADA